MIVQLFDFRGSPMRKGYVVLECQFCSLKLEQLHLNPRWPSWASWYHIYSYSSSCSQHRPKDIVSPPSSTDTMNLTQRAYQVQSASNQMIPHTGTILRPAAPHEHHAVLLDVVPLAGDVGRDDGARRELDTRRLALARVGLLGPDDADAEADALERGAVRVGEGRGDGVAGALALADAAEDLVEGCLRGGRRGECAEEGGW